MLLSKNIPLKYVVGKIKNELLLVTVYATIIAIVYDNFHFTRISIPLSIPMILGTVISLLLAFRSNQAYDRWWEARIIWGSVVNDSRSLARQILCFTEVGYEGDEVHLFRERFVKRQIAWNYALGRSLRKVNVLDGLDRLLSKREMEFVKKYEHKPTALLELHARDLNHALNNGWINTFQQVELDKTLTRLCESMGKCERIKNTVFPATYSLYTHFALNFFIMLLPFGVIEYLNWVAIPLVVAISASFLLIEKMAIHLQDPFESKPTDTPMTAIAQNIEKNLKQMLRDQEISEEVPATTFYVL